MNMSGSSQKDQSKAGKSFDTGSTNALPSVDLASGIFEAHSATVRELPFFCRENVRANTPPIHPSNRQRSRASRH